MFKKELSVGGIDYWIKYYGFLGVMLSNRDKSYLTWKEVKFLSWLSDSGGNAGVYKTRERIRKELGLSDSNISMTCKGF